MSQIFLKSECTCDNCGKKVVHDSPELPEGWKLAVFPPNHSILNYQFYHVCSEDCQVAWLKNDNSRDMHGMKKLPHAE